MDQAKNTHVSWIRLRSIRKKQDIFTGKLALKYLMGLAEDYTKGGS